MPGNRYIIEYLEEVIKYDIAALPKTVKIRIKNSIEEKLMYDPITFGRPLRYSLKGHRRLRVGDYRIVFRIDEKHHKVIVITIKHRKDVYEA